MEAGSLGRVTVRRPVLQLTPETTRRRPDSLAAEEPLELRLDGEALTVTMRTPGHDVELAHGFLATEGVITQAEHVSAARYCAGTDEDGRNTYNVLDLALAPGVPPPDTSVRRNFYTTSSCGVCGKAALDSVRRTSGFEIDADHTRIASTVLTELPERLREAQRVFGSTGGLHAAGIFTSDGQPLVVREDIGRHNAVDKVIGSAIMNGGLPLAGAVLLLSGRASFELIQKAAMAGIPIVAAVSAPSSLAAELASDQGMTLVGFLRGETMNVYTGLERIEIRESP